MKRLGWGVFLCFLGGGYLLFSSSSFAKTQNVSYKQVVHRGGKHSTEKAFADHQKIDEETLKQLILLGKAYQMIKENYVTPPSDKKLVQAAINGMLHSLDGHSTFLNKEQFESIERSTKGEFSGVGLVVTHGKLGYIVVNSVIPDSPADLAGVKAHDIITKIDGAVLSADKPVDLSHLFHQGDRRKVSLSVLRDGRIIKLLLVPADVHVPSVFSDRIQPNIEYIRISLFNEKTENDIVRILSRSQKGNHIKGYILDLRGNPGGLLKEAISVASDFLDSGEIVVTQGRTPEEAHAFLAHKHDLIHGIPIVVLINGQTASAAEILAGALQDHKRAVIMGQQSFGKGSVQTVFPFNDGKEALKMTTQLYYTPSGRSIQGKGITPDIIINPSDADNDKGYIARRQILLSDGIDEGGKSLWDDYTIFKAVSYLKNTIDTSDNSTPFVE